MKIRENKKKKGISLIVLIITIAVIIILASAVILSIANNRPIDSAKEATNLHNESVLKESAAVLSAQWRTESLLGNTTLSRNEYVMQGLSSQGFKEEEKSRVVVGEDGNITVIPDVANNLTQYLEEAKKVGQNATSNKDIGIGTDGKVVNLDLWNYELKDDGISLCASGEASSLSPSYRGEIVDGKIQGTVPQVIYIADKKKVYDVISLYATFSNGDVNGNHFEIKYPPVIPSKVKEMDRTFEGSLLVTAPVIPNGVTNLRETFNGCTNLKNAPVIPSSVMNMEGTFRYCSSLTGNLIINANPSSYVQCLSNAATNFGTQLYLSGTSNKLNEILATKSSNSNIEIKQ